MSDAKISVIIPVYNVEAYVEACLASVAGQTLRDIEIICVDDCGADGSMDIVARFAGRDPRVKIIRHERNMGQGQARNTALAAVTGKYLLYVDSDDLLMPGTLEAVYGTFETHNPVWVWYKYVCFFEEEGLCAQETFYRDFHAMAGGFLDITPDLMAKYPVMACNKAFRTALVREHNLSWPTGILFEDSEYSLKCFTLFPEVYLLNERFYIYRRRRGSVMDLATTVDPHCEDFFTVMGHYYRFLRERGAFEKYRTYFLDSLGSYIGRFLYKRDHKVRVMNAARELLRAMDFPETCRGSRYFDLFETIHAYPGGRLREYLYRPLKLLAAAIPSKTIRRKYTERIRALYQVKPDDPVVEYYAVEDQAPFTVQIK